VSYDSDTPLHEQQSQSNSFEDISSTLANEDFPFDDPAREDRYQQARAELFASTDPRARNNWWMLLIIGFIAFMMFQQGNLKPLQIGILVGVSIFHELGHMLTMRLFGYTDVQIFFIPFFGALVQGRKHTAPAWQQAWVALMGPLPGIIAGLVIYMTMRDDLTSWAFYLVITLLGLNAFNLLPLGFLDGGKFFTIVLFSRNAWIEAGVQVVSAILIGGLAVWQRSIYLGIVALSILLGTVMIFRRGQMVTRLRKTGIQMPDTVDELKHLHVRMLFAATYDVLGGAKSDPKILAQYMRELHHRVLVPPPGWLTTIGFLFIYVLAWALALFTIALIGKDRQEAENKLAVAQVWQIGPKHMALMSAQANAKKQVGEAKVKADEKVKRLTKELNDARAAIEPLRKKARVFDLLERNHFDDPDEFDPDDKD
jgi:Zn-dependent protease